MEEPATIAAGAHLPPPPLSLAHSYMHDCTRSRYALCRWKRDANASCSIFFEAYNAELDVFGPVLPCWLSAEIAYEWGIVSLPFNRAGVVVLN